MKILKNLLIGFVWLSILLNRVLPVTAVEQSATSSALISTPSATIKPSSSPTPTITVTPTAAVTPTITKTILNTSAVNISTVASATPTIRKSKPSFSIRSVSSMNQSKDKVCPGSQQTSAWIAQWVLRAKELDATHVGLETPYDNPVCGGKAGNYSIDYTRRWVTAIRAAGLHIWHRHMFTDYENIYNAGKHPGRDWGGMINTYITSHPDFFKAGDVFTPLAEPSNAGVYGVTYCGGVCMFKNKADFNTVIRSTITNSRDAFRKIGLNNKITMAGVNVDGFALDGLHNPDHQGKFSLLEPATIKIAGYIALDHYPPPWSNMAADLRTIRKTFPNLPLMIGEWGPIFGGDTPQIIKDTFDAFRNDKNIKGVQYWQMGPSGPESLLRSVNLANLNFSAVQYAFSY